MIVICSTSFLITNNNQHLLFASMSSLATLKSQNISYVYIQWLPDKRNLFFLFHTQWSGWLVHLLAGSYWKPNAHHICTRKYWIQFLFPLFRDLLFFFMNCFAQLIALCVVVWRFSFFFVNLVYFWNWNGFDNWFLKRFEKNNRGLSWNFLKFNFENRMKILWISKK